MAEELEYLTLNEIKAFLNSIDDIRDRALITLFLNTGLFLNEITSLKIDSVDWKNKILNVPGNRKRAIPLNDQVFDALAKWSKERPSGNISELFVTTKGALKDLTSRGVDYLIRKYADQAGIKKTGQSADTSQYIRSPAFLRRTLRGKSFRHFGHIRSGIGKSLYKGL